MIKLQIKMAEEKIAIQAKDAKIEGLLAMSGGKKGVVVSHPHPLYGGDMHNNVVKALTEAYFERGYTTCRFNFRGVGSSGGRHDYGKGEQEDVLAAVEFVSSTGAQHVDIVGYSFGSWVNALCLKNLLLVQRMVMISPPVGMMDFSFLGYSPKIKMVITGSSDHIAPSGLIREMLPKWNKEAELKVIDGADHFYWGKEGELSAIIKAII
jgi:alpha/beta superfamily hydrolase